MRTADFDYQLPQELIAQHPAPERDSSRMLVLHRVERRIEHRSFRDLVAFLQPGDVLVLNNSKVIPARLRGRNAASSGQFELLLLEETGPNEWWVMVRPGKRARVDTRITLHDRAGRKSDFTARVLEANEEGHRRVLFEGPGEILPVLENLGEVPLPPYITRANTAEQAEDWGRYQTVFAQKEGSVAAPTAGLHFTPEIIEQLRQKQVRTCFVTLHVGLSTFAPVKSESFAEHRMHEERYELPESTAAEIAKARQAGRRVVAAGTTSLRVLESVAAQHGGSIVAGAGRTRLFVYPPFQFKAVDALLTNFHLPRSTLVMLVSAFAAPGQTTGREFVLSAYAEAVRERYRFFSYGDAMLLL